MPIRFRWPSLLRRVPLLTALMFALICLGSGGVRAEEFSPNQPESIPTDRLPPQPCPLLVPADQPALQPLRIQPSQVARKNRRGCLSAADALYGPDGCPVKLCGKGGAFDLPRHPQSYRPGP